MTYYEAIANSSTPGVATSIANLSGAVTTTTGTTLSVSQAPPSALQSAQFRVLIDTEIFVVATGTTTTTWTVVRGAEGSTAATHAANAPIWHTATAQGLWNTFTLLGRSSVGVTGYTLAATDMNTFIDTTAATAVTFTIPNTSSVAWLPGCQIMVRQGGAGAVGFTAAGGVTVNSRGSLTHTNGLQAVVALLYEGSNAWSLIGDRA